MIVEQQIIVEVNASSKGTQEKKAEFVHVTGCRCF